MKLKERISWLMGTVPGEERATSGTIATGRIAKTAAKLQARSLRVAGQTS